MLIWVKILKAIWLMMPAYFANMVPVISKKIDFLNYPVDFEIKFRNKRLFGKNKTIRGFFFGSIVAIVITYLQKELVYFKFINNISLLNYDHFIIIGLLLGLGALFGDIIESFIKRQINISPGKPLYVIDQIDYGIGAFLLLSFYQTFSTYWIIFVLIINLVLTIVINHLSYLFKIRKEKW